MGKAKHPCDGLPITKAARNWFEQICVGGEMPAPSRKAEEALINFGLIERGPDKVLGRDRFGAISVPQYQAQTWAHYDFCKWASENVPEPDDSPSLSQRGR